jgi:hypothetical protein
MTGFDLPSNFNDKPYYWLAAGGWIVLREKVLLVGG